MSQCIQEDKRWHVLAPVVAHVTKWFDPREDCYVLYWVSVSFFQRMHPPASHYFSTRRSMHTLLLSRAFMLTILVLQLFVDSNICSQAKEGNDSKEQKTWEKEEDVFIT